MVVGILAEHMTSWLKAPVHFSKCPFHFDVMRVTIVLKTGYECVYQPKLYTSHLQKKWT